jgi:hypothetical protein
LRHDYRPDGTATSLLLMRYRDPDEPELRTERTGTWHADASGFVELSWQEPGRTETIRERVWVYASPEPRLAWRVLERGADGVWRGGRWVEEIVDGHARGHEIRIELRFLPARTPTRTVAAETCEVEVTRTIAAWGDGEPATWKNRIRHTCEREADGVKIHEVNARRPEHDRRLNAAHYELPISSLELLSPDVLHHAGWDYMPWRRSRRAEPPLTWQDVRSKEHCILDDSAPSPAPTSNGAAGPSGS